MAAPPELQQLLAQSRDRVAYQNPLFQAVTQMAYGGLPTYARQGTQLSGTLSNQVPAIAPPSGGGMNPLLAAGLGGLGGAALNSLGPNGNALGALIDGIKKLFGHGGNPSNPYGNTTYSNHYDPFAFDPNDPLSGGVDYSQLPGFGTPLPAMPTLPTTSGGVEENFRGTDWGWVGGGGEPVMPNDWWGGE